MTSTSGRAMEAAAPPAHVRPRMRPTSGRSGPPSPRSTRHRSDSPPASRRSPAPRRRACHPPRAAPSRPPGRGRSPPARGAGGSLRTSLHPGSRCGSAGGSEKRRRGQALLDVGNAVLQRRAVLSWWNETLGGGHPTAAQMGGEVDPHRDELVVGQDRPGSAPLGPMSAIGGQTKRNSSPRASATAIALTIGISRDPTRSQRRANTSGPSLSPPTTPPCQGQAPVTTWHGCPEGSPGSTMTAPGLPGGLRMRRCTNAASPPWSWPPGRGRGCAPSAPNRCISCAADP